ncbi:MAG: class I SAM-dependent methyltransferase [Luminiphilus sp.]
MLTVDMESFGLAAGQRLLDVGCGEGRHTLAAYLHTGVMAVGVDLGFDDLQTASGRIADMDAYKPQGEIAFLQGDATGLPFPDDYFDRVVCSEVLEHIPNFIAVLDELNRVLKPGGRLCVSVPRAWPERICWWLSEAYHNTPGGHIRIFNAGFLRGEISRYGLSCYRQHGAHALHVPYWWLRCLLWRQGEQQSLVAGYHRFLVWDLMKRPALTRWLDRLCNPWMGKSVVMYFNKPVGAPL